MRSMMLYGWAFLTVSFVWTDQTIKPHSSAHSSSALVCGAVSKQQKEWSRAWCGLEVPAPIENWVT